MTDEPMGPPPVEPLSDVAWARLERGLWARMDGSTTTRIEPEHARRRWLWIAAPIVAAAAAIVLVVVMRDSTSATEKVAEINGSDANDVRVVAPVGSPGTELEFAL